MLAMLTQIGVVLRSAIKKTIAALLAAIVVLVFFQVVLRYTTHGATHSVAEISRLFLIWIVFLGSAYLISVNDLMKIDLLSGMGGRRLAYAIARLSDLLTIIFLIFMAIYTVDLLKVVSLRIAPATGLSYFWFYVAPVAMAVLGVFFIVERWALDTFASDTNAREAGRDVGSKELAR